MWNFRSKERTWYAGIQCFVDLDAKPAAVADVLRGWREDVRFRSMFNELLARSPFSAFRRETPSVTAATASRPFEFVLLDAPGLARRPDPDAFSEHFRDSPAADVIEFANPGNDAILIAPGMKAAPSAYVHLAAFVREAPEAQRHALWKLVGEAMGRRMSAKPVWLSTAGAGVPYLHVRLDDRPKYYGFTPYRDRS